MDLEGVVGGAYDENTLYEILQELNKQGVKGPESPEETVTTSGLCLNMVTWDRLGAGN